MSLINDVLRDLDNRRSSDPPIRRSGGQRPPPLQPVDPPRRPLGAIAAGVVLIGSIAVAAGFWSDELAASWARATAAGDSGVVAEAPAQGLFGAGRGVVTVDSTADSVVAPERAAAAGDSAAAPRSALAHDPVPALAEAASITAVTISQGPRGDQLELLLSRAVAHRLQERSATQAVLYLPTTRLQTHLPDMAGSPLIAAIDTQQQDTDLVLRISLSGQGEFQTYLLSEAEQARLVVKVFATGQAHAEQVTPPRPQDQQATRAAPGNESPGSDRTPSAIATPQPSFSKTTRQISPAELDQAASDDALALARKGRLRAATRNLEAFIAGAQLHRQASGTLATLLLSRGKLQEALGVLTAARASYPEARALQKLHARILLEQGAYGEALQVLTVAEVESMDAEHLALLASLQQRTGAHGQAVSSYDRLLLQHGEAAPWLVGRAISLEAMGQGDDARATYRQALRSSEIDARLRGYASDRLQALN